MLGLIKLLLAIPAALIRVVFAVVVIAALMLAFCSPLILIVWLIVEALT